MSRSWDSVVDISPPQQTAASLPKFSPSSPHPHLPTLSSDQQQSEPAPHDPQPHPRDGAEIEAVDDDLPVDCSSYKLAHHVDTVEQRRQPDDDLETFGIGRQGIERRREQELRKDGELHEVEV